METLQVASVKDVALQRFSFMNQSSLLHIFLLLKRFGLAMAVFTLCRLLFFLFNAVTFSAFTFSQNIGAFFYGLLFDVSALVYLLAPVIILHILPLPFRKHRIYQLILKILFIICLSLGIALNLIDCEYYKFSGKRTGADLFTAQNDIDIVWLNYVADYWFLLILFFLLVYLVIKLYPALKPQKTTKSKHTLQSYFLQVVYMVVVAGIAFLGARGGIGLRPIRPFDAARFVAPRLVPLALNTPFQVIGTLQGQYAETPDYMPLAEAEKILPLVNRYKNSSPLRKKNVVVIILESFGKEYVGYFNNGKGYTPFLDSLCGKSLLFTQAYANGKRSSDAVPAILSSVPSLLDVPFINSVYSDKPTHTLGYYLQQSGYYSGFFHGARNGSMGFDNFLKLAGNGDYFGLTEYPNKGDFDGSWGIFDEPYYLYMAKTLNTKKQPFCAGIFTISSHHPYPTPPQHKGRFPKGTLPIHRGIRYADYSLEQFFIYASRQKWFNNTLFVITADHSAENETAKYQTSVGKYAIPLIFYTPDGSLKGKIDKPVSHVDILPTVLDYLHFNKPFFTFGKSAFRNTSKPGAIHYEGGIYQYIKDSTVLHFDGSSSIALYNYHKDSFLRENIITQHPVLIAEQEKEIKALLQQFFTRINGAGFIYSNAKK